MNVDISFTIHDLSLELHICTQNIAVEGTVSQIFFIASSSFFKNFWKKKKKSFCDKYQHSETWFSQCECHLCPQEIVYF